MKPNPLRLDVSLACTAVVMVAACAGPDSEPFADSARTGMAVACDPTAARAVVERFGEKLRDVSLLAPDSVFKRTIREAYAPYVRPSLLEVWVAHRDSAPGRKVSSPWPERIAVDTVQAAGLQTCRVIGNVVYVTSADETQGGYASRELVILRVTRDSVWRIDDYDVTAQLR